MSDPYIWFGVAAGSLGRLQNTCSVRLDWSAFFDRGSGGTSNPPGHVFRPGPFPRLARPEFAIAGTGGIMPYRITAPSAALTPEDAP